MNMIYPIIVDWIDDDFGSDKGDRLNLAKALEERSSSKVAIRTHVPEEIEKWLNQLENRELEGPDILLIDLRLKSSEHGKSSTPYAYDSGLKVGSLLNQSEVKSVPKYLVSRAFSPEHVGMHSELFDWVLDQATLAKSDDFLYRDGVDYRKLTNDVSTPLARDKDYETAISSLIRLLRIPEEAKDDVINLLANEVESAYSKNQQNQAEAETYGIHREPIKAITLDISRWVRQSFLSRNGPLVDCLYAGMLFGVRQSYFVSQILPEIIKESPESIYKGIFSSSVDKRFWLNGLLSWGLNKFQEVEISSVSYMAKQFAMLLSVPEEEYSVCAACREKWPDTTARDVEHPDESHWRQVHRKCSRARKDGAIMPGFQELRDFVSE